jgi:DNA (cytosine-5)-methyltransferase 1
MSDILEGKCDRKIGFTLRVGGGGSSIDDRRNWDSYRVNGEVKKIGPEQGRKMMGFPDWYQFPGSRTQSMKQLGNSVAVDAVHEVAKSIISYLKNTNKPTENEKSILKTNKFKFK